MDFLNSSLFTPWADPGSGLPSFILTTRAAPIQQSFYYTNPSLSADGRFYWFYCAFPPAGSASYGRCLGLADLASETVRYFPETQFSHASPAVDALTGEAYWANASGIWKMSATSGAQLVNRFSPALVKNRPVTRYGTHFTFSADRKSVNIDADIGNDTLVGCAPLDGGEIEIWQMLRSNFNHAQFNPRDPDLMLLAWDSRVDRDTGEVLKGDNRLWTIRRGGVVTPVYSEADSEGYSALSTNSHLENAPIHAVTDRRGMHGHEWWSADGSHIWYIHYKQGVERVRFGETSHELVWPHKTVSHGHANSSDDLLVLDSLPPEDPADRRVTFVNLRTGRDVNIVSFMPDPGPELRRYHIHPHPQFCGNDQLICYTTTVLGGVDVAFTKVSDLLDRTA